MDAFLGASTVYCILKSSAFHVRVFRLTEIERIEEAEEICGGLALVFGVLGAAISLFVCLARTRKSFVALYVGGMRV